jgi:hypothetical protein
MNFYSYSIYSGMEYHRTAREAKEATEAYMKIMAAKPEYTAADICDATWGEVVERGVVTVEAGCTLVRQDRLSYESEHPQVVDGRMLDQNDSLVLVKNIHEKDLLFHDLVLSIAVIWKGLSGKIQRFKQHNFEDVATVLDLLFEKYKVKRGGQDGNMQFFTFDRRFKLTINVQKKINFGPELQAAQAKLNEALDEMTSNDTSDLRTLVTAAFSLDGGQLRVAEVLRLRGFKIENEKWNEAMQIINDAIVVISSKKQIRLYERDTQGEYIAIPLDIAAL